MVARWTHLLQVASGDSIESDDGADNSNFEILSASQLHKRDHDFEHLSAPA